MATLATATAADALPWSDLTKAYLAEMRFHSIASWLPGDEANSLRQRFAAELERLYLLAGEGDLAHSEKPHGAEGS